MVWEKGKSPGRRNCHWWLCNRCCRCPAPNHPHSRAIWLEMGLYTSRAVRIGLGAGLDGDVMEEGQSSSRPINRDILFPKAGHPVYENPPKQVRLHLYPDPLFVGSGFLFFNVLGP